MEGKKIVVYPNSGEAYNAKSKTWLGTSNPRQFVEMSKEGNRLMKINPKIISPVIVL